MILVKIMSYSVGSLWIIYIAVVLVSFIGYWLILRKGIAFFFAISFGAIAVFMGGAWLDPNQLNTTDKTWLSVLFLVAFLLPIFFIVYVVWIEILGCIKTAH